MAAEFKAPTHSHSERLARHAEAKASALAAHSKAIARADQIRGEAHDQKASTLAALEADHQAAHSAACIESARHVAAGLAEVVAAFTAAPSRATAANLAARFKELETAALAASGAPLNRELGFAFAADLIAKNPSALPRFALIGAFNSNLLGALEACEAANRACRMPSASSAPVVLQALEALERQIARIAAEGDAAPAATAAERWDAIQFSGSYAAATRRIGEIEKQERRPLELEAFAATQKHHRAFEILRSVSSLLASDEQGGSK
jgi:hypothetical protein